MNTNLLYQLKWGWSLTKEHKGRLGLFFLLELFAIGLSLLFVLWSKKAIDLAMSAGSSSLNFALLITVLCLLGSVIIRLFTDWLNARTLMQLTIKLQNMLIKSQMLASWKFVKRWHTGDIQVRINTDSQEIVQMLGHTGPSFILTAIRLFFSFGFLWLMDPMLAFMILGISPLFFFSKLYFRKLRALNQKLKASESSFGNVVQENLRFRMSIRALGLQFNRWQKVLKAQDTMYQLRRNLQNFGTLSQGMMKFTLNAGFILTFVWGVHRLHAQEISFGTMTAFLQLVGRIQSPILTMMSFVPMFIRFRTAVDRVQELLAVETELELAPVYITEPKAIRLDKVQFKYEDSLIIEQLDAQFEVGKPTAIIGSSGKGKTTLIRLLLALISPDKGSIHIDSTAAVMPLTTAHRVNFAYVPQGDKLFTGTIRENLQVHDSVLEDAKLKDCLYLACAEFVYTLPDGLDTLIGESGYGLSEGQAQRIAIARALTREGSIWLFDEITSALDTATSELLMQRLMEAGKEKIVVFVTHDLKLATTCSQTIYI